MSFRFGHVLGGLLAQSTLSHGDQAEGVWLCPSGCWAPPTPPPLFWLQLPTGMLFPSLSPRCYQYLPPGGQWRILAGSFAWLGARGWVRGGQHVVQGSLVEILGTTPSHGEVTVCSILFYWVMLIPGLTFVASGLRLSDEMWYIHSLHPYPQELTTPVAE